MMQVFATSYLKLKARSFMPIEMFLLLAVNTFTRCLLSTYVRHRSITDFCSIVIIDTK